MERLPLEKTRVLYSGVVGGGDRVDFIVDDDLDLDAVDFDEAVRSHCLIIGFPGGDG